MNQLTSTRAIAAKQLERTVTQASADSAVQQIKNLAQIQANNYSMAAITAGTQGIKELLNLSVSQLRDAVLPVFQAQNQQEQIGIAQAHLALDSKRFTLQKEEFDWKKAEKEKGEAAGQYVQDMIIKGSKALWSDNPEKWIAPNSPKLLGIISGRTPLSGDLRLAFERGEINSRAANPDGSNRIVAVSPSDLSEVLKYKPSLSQASGPIIKLTQETQAYIQDPQNRNNADLKPFMDAVAAKDEDAAKRAFDKLAQGRLNAAGAKVDGPNNPYYLPAVAELVNPKTGSPKLQELPLWKVAIGPMIAAGVNSSDPNVMLNAAANAVKEGKITANAMAVDLATIYKQGQRMNIQARQMTALGYAPEAAYRVQIDKGLDSHIVNMADPREILKEYMQHMSRANPFGAN